ncbi:chromate efflux transporter [Chloroflexus sp.]|uniref:chromate efflux transporter n=1 Tax=Chloroflexus sp. TaxID=1904827 RepID=UPI00298F11DB|nr:chromate efflux transporter [Chloroflexus sp.]MCS6888341.1 chromate efflux transporter [Chloroflexus sp.]MDW8405383.1 chromate efflux transporter [Chloroflexus sp.]
MMSPLKVFLVFLRLGLTSFGGPVAHLGYFRAELVERRRWLDEATYADLIALCQFLPGPASSQVGIAIGTIQAGVLGGLAAWLGFTLPSALAMIGFAYGVTWLGDPASGWLHGLKVVVVAVVAQAVWQMAQRLCPDRLRASMAIAAAMILLIWPDALVQLLVIGLGGLVGWRLLRVAANNGALIKSPITSRAGIGFAALFAVLLGGSVLAAFSDNATLALLAGMVRSGSLVFGGGHVVLPLLEPVVVGAGFMPAETFIAGYGAAQAVPGPLLSFSAYLGAMAAAPPGGWLGGLLALVAIFLPSFLLVWAALPFWAALRAQPAAQAALAGINAAVVGILLAALYQPVITSAIRGPLDVALALSAFAALHLWRAPPWAVVVAWAVMGNLGNE